MTGAFGASLHFAAHLLGLTVALGAAFVVAGDREERRVARAAGFLAFALIAAGEAVHGAAFAGDLVTLPVTLRTAGYALVAGYVLSLRSTRSTHAVFALPAQGLPAALAAFGAAIIAVLRRRDPRHLALAAGMAMLGVAEGVLAARGRLTWGFQGYHAIRTVGFLMVAWFVLITTRRSIQFRIVAGFVSLLLVVVLGVAAPVAQIVARNLRSGALQRVEAQGLEVGRSMIPLVRDKVSTLIALGSTETVSDHLRRQIPFARRDVESLRTRVLPGVDYVMFLGPRGAILGRAGIGPGVAFEVVGTDVVDRSLSTGLEAASIDELATDQLTLVGISAVTSRGRTIGFVVAGYRLDSVFADALTPGGSRVAIFRGAAIPQTVAEVGFPPGDEPLVPRGALMRAWQEVRSDGESRERELRLRGGRHFVSFAPLSRQDGSVVGMLMVAEPAAILAATQRDVNRILFLVTLGVVGLAFLSSLLAARRISRPVRALTMAAQRVQAGDLAAKAPVTGTDEVGNLATAFNRMTASISDMTDDLRDAAEEQARLRGRLETVVDSMNEGLIAVDQDGRVVTSNQAASAIVGRPSGALLGEHLADLVTGLAQDGSEVELVEAAPEDVSFIRRGDGTDVPVAISSGPLRGSGGEVLGHVYVLRDMTREHEMERMKSEFLSNVSHELRTPLTPIIGYAEILQRRDVPKERAADFASGILVSAKRLERIVAMLVDFSAMEGGRMTIATERLPVRSLVADAVSEWEGRSNLHRFRTRIAKKLPPARADLQLVRRTLSELIDNAVKYSPSGGTVTVGVSGQDGRGRRMLVFEVADQGIGIEPDDLQGIFQDFRQVDASDTRTYGGLGLGLAFVKRIVEAHGGTIEAESAPGEGATFRFTLPAADMDGERRGRGRA